MPTSEARSPSEADLGPSSAGQQTTNSIEEAPISADQTMNNIHTFLFDTLAFFSNCQSSLIADYCQEKDNVRIDQRSLRSFHLLVGSNPPISQR